MLDHDVVKCFKPGLQQSFRFRTNTGFGSIRGRSKGNARSVFRKQVMRKNYRHAMAQSHDGWSGIHLDGRLAKGKPLAMLRSHRHIDVEIKYTVAAERFLCG